MSDRLYTIEIVDRGEGIIYSDAQVRLHLQRTHIHADRVYCDGTSGKYDNGCVSPEKRAEIIERLCEAFETKTNPTIFVIDEADADREKLEGVLAKLIAAGHRITVEYDSHEKRRRLADEMIRGLLRAGKRVTVNGATYATIHEYESRHSAPSQPLKNASTAGGGRRADPRGRRSWWKFW